MTPARPAPYPRAIGVKDTVRWDGETWTVSAFDGTNIHLGSPQHHAFVIAEATVILFAADFAVIKAASPGKPYGAQAPSPLDDFPPEVIEAAREREAMLLLARTGYPVADPDPDMPRDGSFDGLTDKERYARVGKYFGRSSRAVERWIEAYDLYGLAGLLDKRPLAQRRGVSRIDPVLRDHILAVLNPHESRLTNKEIHHRIRARLADHIDPETGRSYAHLLPPQRTLDRHIAALAPPGWKRATKTRRSEAERPVGVVPWHTVARPMEWVLLDTTPLDMFAMDPGLHPKKVWQTVYLTLAIDVYSRSIVGWVFTVGEPRSEDIALLLYRIAAPKITQPGWPNHARWRYPGVPDNLVFAGPTEVAYAGVPFGHVDTYVVDHGKVYISRAVQEAARLLGSHLQLARVRTPTDKAHVEIAFKRIRQQFVMRLPGYKGPDIHSRGAKAHVEDRAFSFIWEIEDDFAAWVASDYQHTIHRGLTFQSCPDLPLTPNEVYDFGVTRSGLIPVPPPPGLLIELLPSQWRTVQHYGIEVDGIRYDDNALDPYRNEKSPYTAHKGKWKVKVDRTDRSLIWFWACDLDNADTTRGHWLPVYYRGWADAPVFGDAEIAYAKHVILGRGGNPRDYREFESVLDRILRRIGTQAHLPGEERRKMGIGYLHQAIKALQGTSPGDPATGYADTGAHSRVRLREPSRV